MGTWEGVGDWVVVEVVDGRGRWVGVECNGSISTTTTSSSASTTTTTSSTSISIRISMSECGERKSGRTMVVAEGGGGGVGVVEVPLLRAFLCSFECQLSLL